MNYSGEKITCDNCIWNNQCSDKTPCGHYSGFDDGELPSDIGIEIQIEAEREVYRANFERYLSSNYAGKTDYFNIQPMGYL